MTPTSFTGFNHRVLSARGAGLFGEVPASGISFVQRGAAWEYALRWNPSASTAIARIRDVEFSDQTSTIVYSFYVEVASIQSGQTTIIECLPGGGGDNFEIVWDDTASKFGVRFSSDTATLASTTQSKGTTTRYLIDVLVNMTATTWTVQWKIDGVAQTTHTSSTTQTANNVLYHWRVGSGNNATADVYFWHPVMANASADFPIGPHYVRGYVPNGVGTHNLDAATSTYIFKDVGGTETFLTSSETTSYQTIDDVPMDADTDHIGIRAASGGLATPAFINVGAAVAAANNVAATTTLNPTMPTGYAVGDCLLIYTSCRTNGPSAPATPSGWTLLANISGTNGRLVLFGKIATSTSESSPNIVWTGLTTGTTSATVVMAQCAAFSGVDLSSVDVTGTVENGAAATTTVAGGNNVTTTTDKCLVLSLGTRTDDTGGTWTAGTGFTMIGSAVTTSGADMSQGWKYAVKTPAGAVTVPDFGISGSSFASSGVAIALKAASTLTQPTNTWYTEHTMEDSGESSAPIAVIAIVKLRQDTAANCSITAKLRANGAEGNIYSGDINTTNPNYLSALFRTAPGGAAWTDTLFDGATIRWGYTNDADGTPRLDAAMYEALFLVSGTTTPVAINAGVTLTGALAAAKTKPVSIPLTITLAGALARTVLFLRAIAATLTMTAAVTPRSTRYRSLPVTMTATGALTRVVKFLRTLAATNTNTGALTFNRSTGVAISGSATLTSALTKKLIWNRAVVGAVNLTAGLAVKLTFFRTVAASLNSGPALVRQLLMKRAISSTATLTGTTVARRTTSKQQDSTATLTAVLVRKLLLLKGQAASLVLGPNLVRQILLKKSMAVGATLTPDLQTVSGNTKPINATTTLTPTLAKLSSLLRSEPVNMTITSNMAKLTLIKSALSLSVSLSPVLTRRLAYFRAFNASAALSAALTRVSLAKRAVSSGVTLTPTLSKVKIAPRNIVASLVLTPSVQKAIARSFARTTDMQPAMTSQAKFLRSQNATTTVTPGLIWSRVGVLTFEFEAAINFTANLFINILEIGTEKIWSRVVKPQLWKVGLARPEIVKSNLDEPEEPEVN